MNTPLSTQEIDLKSRKATGRSYLNSGRVVDAVQTFAEILRDFPQDVESCLILGDLYLAGEDSQTAEKLYRHALEIEPQNLEIHQRILLAQSEPGSPAAEPVPTDPEAIARLLQRLTGSPEPVAEAEIDKAAELLERIIHSPDPADQVARNLDRIDSLLPALIELNIRQARADGRPDLANSLMALKRNIELQLESQFPVDMLTPASQFFGETLEPLPPCFQGRVAVLVPDAQNPTGRMSLIAESLSAVGCAVSLTSASPLASEAPPDVIIACNPHVNPQLMGHLATCSALRIPVILDLDTDFEHMPISHPDYATHGLGQPVNARAYATALLLADRITVPSEAIAASLAQAGYDTQVIPEGWSRQNALWEKQAPPHASINIGWVGVPGQVEDLVPIRRIIIRVLREFSQTNLVIVGDPKAYQLFENIPQNRRLFLPSVGYEDFPYLLGQIDILLVPLQNKPFNFTQSDRVLMEAGIKKIPWIASPIPALGAWRDGGVLANTPDEWHMYLRQLVLDPELRETMGAAGSLLSQGREAGAWSRYWLDVIAPLVTNSPDPLAVGRTG